jgi:hypothetical protein
MNQSKLKSKAKQLHSAGQTMMANNQYLPQEVRRILQLLAEIFLKSRLFKVHHKGADKGCEGFAKHTLFRRVQ